MTVIFFPFSFLFFFSFSIIKSHNKAYNNPLVSSEKRLLNTVYMLRCFELFSCAYGYRTTCSYDNQMLRSPGIIAFSSQIIYQAPFFLISYILGYCFILFCFLFVVSFIYNWHRNHWLTIAIIWEFLHFHETVLRVQSQVESHQRLKKMVLDAALLNTDDYKVRIKAKMEQSKEWSSALPYTSV